MIKTESIIDYNKFWENNPSHHYHPSVRLRNKFIIDSLKNEKFESLLDTGCGDGYLLNFIDSNFRGKKLCGMDISSFIIEKNKIAFENIDFEVTDISSPELTAKKDYDIVVCSEVIEHLGDWRSAINNLNKLLKQNGILILTTQSGKRYKSDINLGHLQHYELKYLTDELFNNGFKIKKAYKKGFPFYNLQKIIYQKIESTANKYQHGSAGLSIFGRAIFFITYILFLITPRTKKYGPQIFIKAVKIKNNDK